MSKKILVLECVGGISGNMMLGALVDLGLELGPLESELKRLGIEGFEIILKKEAREGISGAYLDVAPRGSSKNEEVPYSRIRAFLEGLPELPYIQRAVLAFDALAVAEAKVHGTTPEAVHFHELGAVDALVDILGNAFALDWLGVGEVFCMEVPVGQGLVQTRHGAYPSPAPATLELLKGFRLIWRDVPHEMVTPTGAVLLKTFVRRPGVLPYPFVLEKTGYGLGTAHFPGLPNVLRATLGNVCHEGGGGDGLQQDSVWELAFQVDDMTPEEVQWALQALMDAGALDVFLSQGLMKKGRPGFLLEVLVSQENKEAIVSWVLKNTSSWGVRESWRTRSILARQEREVQTSMGSVRLKASVGFVQKEKVAFDDVCRIAGELGQSPGSILDRIKREVEGNP